MTMSLRAAVPKLAPHGRQVGRVRVRFQLTGVTARAGKTTRLHRVFVIARLADRHVQFNYY